ncbi:unnamed protein product [Blumeria hordei]|uniref:Leucine-rich repeat-containing protein 40 n=1 Tax=Blumeria hordei TaxID=2867405 RepID=A0A383ULA7_BLUHO|nr:unnamed protein product [Blumeria hordei]
MEQPPSDSHRPSGIPRLSRLPIPTSTLRQIRSKETLQPSNKCNPSKPEYRQPHSLEHKQVSSKSTISTTHENLDATRALRTRIPSTGSVSTHIPRSPLGRPNSHKILSDSHKNTVSGGTSHRENKNTFTTEESNDETGAYNLSRSSRPSLSERTVETLQSLPPSPSLRRRDSNFFNSDADSRSDSRPNSSSGLRNSGGIGSGPEISRGSISQTLKIPQPRKVSIPSKISTNTKSLRLPSTPRNLAPNSPTFEMASEKSKLSPNSIGNRYNTRSTPLSTRSMKQRSSVIGLFQSPSVAIIKPLSQGTKPTKPTQTSRNLSVPKDDTSNLESTKLPGVKLAPSTSGNNEVTPRKSSAALREQISKAKAAAKRVNTSDSQQDIKDLKDIPVIPSVSFDFGLSSDPFNQKVVLSSNKELLIKRVQSAQTSGRLNISAMELKEIPEEVLNMYSLQSMGETSWAEAVDLTKFVAADNQIDKLSDDAFPDYDFQREHEEDETHGNQFAGLQVMDMHGNRLSNLPIGLRRLQLLTTLNLANNQLNNSCLDVISQISSLRDLNLNQNVLTDQLEMALTKLKNLEVLNLSQNKLSTLPESLVELGRLRTLNIAENSFKSLPFNALCKLPLTELNASKNKLGGTLIPEDIDELHCLKLLDVSKNMLTSLHVSANIKFPALQQLNCSFNNLIDLPDMTGWDSLLTITAEDNHIEALPQDFVALPKLKNVNFDGNNLKVLDDRIGRMESLEVLRINGNPLRNRKLIGIPTEDLKQLLLARLEPEIESEREKDADSEQVFFLAHESPCSSPPSASSEWSVQAGGILDISNSNSSSLNPIAAAEVAFNHRIKILQIHHNTFKTIPLSISNFAVTLTTLNLSNNELADDTYFCDKLELPALQELNLCSNTISSLEPLCHNLQAKNLERLDVSFNRVTFIPILPSYFPALKILIASHNKIKVLSPESITGMNVVDCSSNEINCLNAKIGLLGGSHGLRSLDVSGNCFKVPKYTILEKGTEATLAWLRDKIPANELSNYDTHCGSVD